MPGCFLAASLCRPLNNFYVLFIVTRFPPPLNPPPTSYSFFLYIKEHLKIYDVKKGHGLRNRVTRNLPVVTGRAGKMRPPQ